jgi:hypothetical protein
MSEAFQYSWASEETARRRIRSTTGPVHPRRIADLAIPQRVASLPSPLPLRQAFAKYQTHAAHIAVIPKNLIAGVQIQASLDRSQLTGRSR